MRASPHDSHGVKAMNNVNGGADSIGTMFPLSGVDVVIDYRKAICYLYAHIHSHHYNLGFTLQETSFSTHISVNVSASVYS